MRPLSIRTWLGLAASCVLAGTAQSALAAAETGDLHRHYWLPEAQEDIPYRLFVPSSYDGSKVFPMIVVLHGSSSTADEAMDKPALKELAERNGVIVLAPQGYSPFGGYGNIYPVVVTREAASQVDALLEMSRPGANAPAGSTSPPADAGPAAPDDAAELKVNGLTDPRVSRLSEIDTMNVIAAVRKEYRIDDNRIYLMGNSMGGIGAAYLAVRHPEIWAAIAPSGGPFAEWSYPYFRLREGNIAALFVQGDADEYAHWTQADALVRRARKEGVDARLLVADGDHVHAWVNALPQIFEFFLAHRKDLAPASGEQ